MSLPESQNLIVSESAGVLTVTLHRPQVRNAMSLAMVRELTMVFRQAEPARDLRALVLRGAQGNFSAGADVQEFAEARGAAHDAQHDPVRELNAAFGHMCAAFAQLSLPTLCALEGAVLGGGFGLACASDVTLASETVVFGLPETSLGVVPAQIAPFLVERLGFAQAKRLALSGGRIGAREALALGLVHELYPDGAALEQACASAVARLLLCAPEATRNTKRLLLRARREPAEALIEHAAELFATALRGAEGEEGTRAFREKRKPAWVPKPS